MSYAEASFIIDEVGNKVDAAGVGIAPSNMQQFNVSAGDGKVTIKALEPADTIIDGQLLASVRGFYIVMSETGYPVNETDGTVVADHTADGSVLTQEVTGLTNDKQYYFCAFPYTDHGVVNRAAGLRVLAGTHANRAVCTPQAYILYGFRRTKNDSNPAARLVATDMAVGVTPASMDTSTGTIDLGGWANAWFVTGNKPCMIKYDGSIDYYLNPDDYTKKTDGTASDVANSSYEGNAMALFPTVWLYRYEDSNYEYVKFCNIKLDDNYKAYAHQREDGTIMDWFARSLYDGCNISNKIRSISGQTPCNSVAGNTQLSYAQANGDLWESDTWSRVALIWDLLRLMSLNDNVQDAWGYGHYQNQSSSSTNYYKSGKGNTYGQFYGLKSDSLVKVFHLENFWGNIWKLMQGLVYNTTGKYGVKMCRPYSTTGSDYEATSYGLAGTNGGYQSAHHTSEYGTLPYTVSGSENTYIPDGCWWNTSQQNFARFGCHGVNGLLVGCALNLYSALSYSLWTCGVALTCEQPAA